jgi:hypothetical protein
MEKLEKLAKVLRYAGLNLTPQILQIVLDKNVRHLIDVLSQRLEANPNLALDDIDSIIDEIQQAAEKQAVADAAPNTTKKSGKPALEKA